MMAHNAKTLKAINPQKVKKWPKNQALKWGFKYKGGSHNFTQCHHINLMFWALYAIFVQNQ